MIGYPIKINLKTTAMSLIAQFYSTFFKGGFFVLLISSLNLT